MGFTGQRVQGLGGFEADAAANREQEPDTICRL